MKEKLLETFPLLKDAHFKWAQCRSQENYDAARVLLVTVGKCIGELLDADWTIEILIDGEFQPMPTWFRHSPASILRAAQIRLSKLGG